jgi:hypothetical protein
MESGLTFVRVNSISGCGEIKGRNPQRKRRDGQDVWSCDSRLRLEILEIWIEGWLMENRFHVPSRAYFQDIWIW